MKYKVIDYRQRKIDEQIAKERKKFINGTYIIAFIQMIITLISTFYFIKIPIIMDSMLKCVILYSTVFLTSWCFVKEQYSNKYFTILTNIYYISGTIIWCILFGKMLGYVFQVVIEAGNKAQIIPAILIVLIIYMYTVFLKLMKI